MNKQVDDDGTPCTNGLGDITAMGQYLVFKSSGHPSSPNSLNQQLWMGGGVKMDESSPALLFISPKNVYS
jgi:hypothetical protein